MNLNDLAPGASFANGGAAYPNAQVPWAPDPLNPGSVLPPGSPGLDAVTQPAQNHPISPMQRIYNKPKVSDVMNMLASSGADAATMQAILAATTAPYEQQQALMAQKRTELATAATTASATLPLGQAQAALNTQFPQFVGKPAMDSAMSGGYGTATDPGALGLLNPAYANGASDPSAFDTADQAPMAAALDAVTTQPTLDTKGGQTDATSGANKASLMAYQNAAHAFALANGMNEAGAAKAVAFATQYWNAKAGIAPGTQAAPSSGGFFNGLDSFLTGGDPYAENPSLLHEMNPLWTIARIASGNSGTG